MPDTALRPELETPPERMTDLPVHRGYPVPFFVALVNGIPDFRVVRPESFKLAHEDSLCWVCGKRLGRFKVFVLGPMCCVTRTSSELPCHRDCAVWSARNCPFLARPHMVRNESDLPEGIHFAGNMVERNPGVTGLWSCHAYSLFPDDKGNPLVRVGEAVAPIVWYAQGREAGLGEVSNALASGVALLIERHPEEKADIEAMVREFQAVHGVRF